jgi:hypothetical protein
MQIVDQVYVALDALEAVGRPGEIGAERPSSGDVDVRFQQHRKRLALAEMGRSGMSAWKDKHARADSWRVGVKPLFDADQTLGNARILLTAHHRTRLSLSGIPWTQISGQSPKGVFGGAETGSS